MKLSIACLVVVAMAIGVESGIDPATLATLNKLLSGQAATQAGAPQVAGQQNQQASIQTDQPKCPTVTCAYKGSTCTSNSDCCAPYTCQNSPNSGCGVCCDTPNCGSDFDGCCSDSDCCEGYSCYTAQVNVTTYHCNPPELKPFYDSVCLPNSTYMG